MAYMTAPATIVLMGPRSREQARLWISAAPNGSVVSFKGPRRTLSQNDRLHAMLTHVARQVEWGGKKRTIEAWKCIFTAALLSSRHELDIVPGINGGFVLLGMHTSDLKKDDFSDLILLIEAWAAENSVDLQEPEDV